MDNWVLCEPSWQRNGPKRETTERVKTPRPCWKSSIFHCFKIPSATCRSTVEISKQLHLCQTHIKQPFKAEHLSLSLSSALLFLLEETKLDTMQMGSSSTSLKFLAPCEAEEGSDRPCLHKCWCRRKDERRLSCQRDTGEIPSPVHLSAS